MSGISKIEDSSLSTINLNDPVPYPIFISRPPEPSYSLGSQFWNVPGIKSNLCDVMPRVTQVSM